MLKRAFRFFTLWFALGLAAIHLSGCGGKGESAVAPSGVAVVPGDGRVAINWTAQPGVEYWVFYSEGAGTTPQNWNDPGRNGRAVVNATAPFIATGLTNGKLYSFSINGRKDGGPGGPGSPSISATPRLAGTVWATSAPVANAEFASASAAGTGTFTIVSVGANGGIYTTDDGLTWTSRGSAAVTTKNLNSVSTNGFTTVAVGDDGTIVRSTDPATWATVTSGTTAKLNGVAWATSGIAAAVGNGGVVLSSTNGTDWIARTSGSAADLATVAWVNNRFLAVGAKGTVLESTDTVTWTARSIASETATLRGAAYGTTDYVVLGDTGVIYTSTDLTTWTKQNSGVSVNLNAVTVGSQLIAVGDGGTIVTSTDGKTWAKVASGTTANLRGATARAGGYVLVGAGGVSLTSY
jgi:hypothetical protein